MSPGPPLAWDVVAAVTVACLLGSALFSGSETGVMSVSRIRLRHLARRGPVPGLARLEALLRRIEDPVMTCLIGNNLVNVWLSAVWTAALGARYGVRGEWAAGTVAALLTIVVGEIVPKVVFREYPERATLAVGPLIRGAMVLFWPARLVLRGWSALLRRLLPGGAPAGGATLGRDTLAALLLGHPELAGEDERFAGVLERFLALSSVRLRDIMIPLARAVTVPASADPAAAAVIAAESGYSRLPVAAEDGRVTGWLLARDLLFPDAAAAPPGRGGGLPPGLVRSCLYVDEALLPYELFEEMQGQRQQLAIVVARDGAPLGLVTLENLVEAVVGRIEDEFDAPAGAAA